MGATAVLRALFGADYRQTDPGTGKAIRPTKYGAQFSLTIAAGASETNTLRAPTRRGQRITIMAYSVGASGTRVITAPAALDKTGSLTMTFSAAKQMVTLEAVQLTDSTYRWHCVYNHGVVGPVAEIPSLTAATAFAVSAADGLTVNGVIVPTTKTVTLNMLLNTHCVDQAFFIADRAYQVTAISEVHATAGDHASAVNMQVTKDTGTNAPGAGTDLLTNNTNAGFDMKGTANTVQNGTLTATTASLQLAAGNRLSVDFAGDAQNLVGVQVTVTLKPI